MATTEKEDAVHGVTPLTTGNYKVWEAEVLMAIAQEDAYRLVKGIEKAPEIPAEMTEYVRLSLQEKRDCGPKHGLVPATGGVPIPNTNPQEFTPLVSNNRTDSATTIKRYEREVDKNEKLIEKRERAFKDFRVCRAKAKGILYHPISKPVKLDIQNLDEPTTIWDKLATN
ncbi:hypothetical protein BJ508DRAFT_331236 [Ascobolus immersus RN42]|uniref:Uncharacterized protein n=1 Tax=Ascobolus immersus RN42 TaxID=1160509 RepID=A0A3N4HWA9_ASCIM|nr:hypothetical protein BJ508DRAFT_331236 [Ascobolus immersus RN42]